MKLELNEYVNRHKSSKKTGAGHEVWLHVTPRGKLNLCRGESGSRDYNGESWKPKPFHLGDFETLASAVQAMEEYTHKHA